MKKIIVRVFLSAFLGMAFASCSAMTESFRVVMPELPETWQGILGGAHWRLLWIDAGGSTQTASLAPSAECSVTLLNDAGSPVIAYPYWPEHGINSGDMKPAGAIFPWDIREGTLALSWQGGIDAVFWREMSLAENDNTGSAARSPAAFNWVGWRSLWGKGSFPDAVLQDPWRCDWSLIGGKTAASGFDKRRVTAANYPLRTFPPGQYSGLWYGASPFDSGISAAEGEALALPLAGSTNLVFNERGILRFSEDGAIFSEFR